MSSSLADTADIAFLYVTFPHRETALRIGRDAVERRLAACMNLFAESDSVYRWKDAVETATEHVALFKTTTASADALSTFIRAQHPYEVPCVVSLGTASVDKMFAQWIRESVDRR